MYQSVSQSSVLSPSLSCRSLFSWDPRRDAVRRFGEPESDHMQLTQPHGQAEPKQGNAHHHHHHHHLLPPPLTWLVKQVAMLHLKSTIDSTLVWGLRCQK
ncbi:unnamed protein product [Periconia digitata]|uniref:Uncharacterized protein n=1 Tax=Periconia digitata TaxID=1303443 RepID=A0A9W4UTB1_9PLEO|nr:unnamed protein product [Periconia digitata]